jgi:hypothetical protein
MFNFFDMLTHHTRPKIQHRSIPYTKYLLFYGEKPDLRYYFTLYVTFWNINANLSVDHHGDYRISPIIFKLGENVVKYDVMHAVSHNP